MMVYESVERWLALDVSKKGDRDGTSVQAN
jgi:hypothetical protein